MKNPHVFDGLISKLVMAMKIISELEDISINAFKAELKRGKKRKNRLSKNCGTTTKDMLYI